MSYLIKKLLGLGDKKIEDIILVPLRLDEVECQTQTENEIVLNTKGPRSTRLFLGINFIKNEEVE